MYTYIYIYTYQKANKNIQTTYKINITNNIEKRIKTIYKQI